MKQSKVITLLFSIILGFSGLSQTNISKAKYGEGQISIYNYFFNFFTEEIKSETYKRSIFRLGIDEHGGIKLLEVINHPFDEAVEQKIVDKVKHMKWQPKMNPNPIASTVYLVLIIDANGNLKIETY